MTIALFLSVYLVLATLACAAPVDTHQFGLLKRGMSQATVLARLGPPDHVTPLGSVHTVSRGRHGSGVIVREQVREAWDYDGTAYIGSVRLVFSNGVLVEKVKGR